MLKNSKHILVLMDNIISVYQIPKLEKVKNLKDKCTTFAVDKHDTICVAMTGFFKKLQFYTFESISNEFKGKKIGQNSVLELPENVFRISIVLTKSV
jgi:hypothetical protein